MIEVTAAILFNSAGKVLVAQRRAHRKMGLKWEFPGGKRESGEDLLTCLERELREELGITAHDLMPFTHCDYDYEFGAIRLYAFIGRFDGEIFSHPDHEQVRWVDKARLPDLEWAPADVPIIQKLLEGS